MKIEYDKKADVLYLQIQEKYVAKSKEVDGGAVVDLDRKGNVVGFEVLDVSKKYKLSDVCKFSVKNLSKDKAK